MRCKIIYNITKPTLRHLITVLIIFILITHNKSTSDIVKQDRKEWFIIFYTGSKLWAGTDSEIIVELNGSNGNAKPIRIRPRKHQLEANGVDTISLGDLDGKILGNLKSIIVVKQHSYSLFTDWQLIKAEVIDPDGKLYLFECNCWLTNLNYKRLIRLTKTQSDTDSESDDETERSYSTRNTRVFPATLVILFILLLLIFFTYFGNEICKKWRESILIFTRNVGNTSNHVNQSPRLNESRSLDQNCESGANIPLNNAIEDKPPDYKDLFPIQRSNSNNQTNNQDASIQYANVQTNSSTYHQEELQSVTNTSQTKNTTV